MLSVRWACPVVLAVACGSPTPGVARPQTTDAGAKSETIPSEPSSPDDTAARVARVEHGLVPEVRVKGESGGASIEDRLRVHRTPGVSVAIIHDHRVVSAKGYGVADVGTGARLSPSGIRPRRRHPFG
jgi:CubicO group peptidase (beta-lactamase class C family)